MADRITVRIGYQHGFIAVKGKLKGKRPSKGKRKTLEPLRFQGFLLEVTPGFELTIDEPSWSPFRGYTIRWKVTADSENVYYFIQDGEAPNTFEYLECNVDGQWYRLSYTQDTFPFTTIEFALGGAEGSALEGSIVQKYDYYGTRLKAGLYRAVLEMKAKDGTPHFLAAEFIIK